ncbi:MAG: efflux RND transporter periplasmic adaptor subunit [Pirellulales bacterium]
MFSLIAVLVILGVAFGPKYLAGTKNPAEQVAVVEIQPKTFNHSVIEPGEVESSNNTEIRCEVQARNTSGVMIIEIVPNGTTVQPGDFLVRFDSSALENEKNLQLIACNNSKATLSQSKAAYDTAVITREEYIQGINKQEEQVIQSEVFVAEENLRRAEEYARYSERLAARGYVTGVQVEADRFAVDKAKKDLDAAQTKLRVLKDYTRQKMVKTLDANIESAEAKMAADENSYKLEQSKLQLIENQIAKCRVVSPVAGKAVYANVQGGRGQSEVLIQEGTMIRERQPVIRIPDLGKMQVMAKINEARIGYVSNGQRASVRLEAFPDVVLPGRVTRVDENPIPMSWMSAQVRQYSTYVQIDNPPEGMVRPGLTAKVEIHVDSLTDALVAPIATITDHSGEYYCLIKEGGKIVPKWVELGSSNETEVVIRSGLQAGDQNRRAAGRLYQRRNRVSTAAAGQILGRKIRTVHEGRADAIGKRGGQRRQTRSGDAGQRTAGQVRRRQKRQSGTDRNPRRSTRTLRPRRR